MAKCPYFFVELQSSKGIDLYMKYLGEKGCLQQFRDLSKIFLFPLINQFSTGSWKVLFDRKRGRYLKAMTYLKFHRKPSIKCII
jgi:hypothetical protein